MNLKLITHCFSVCKVNTISEINLSDPYVFFSKTDEELSLVCLTESAPADCIEYEHGWKAFRIEGILDFSLIGILSKLSSILAAHQIGIFVVSTFNTDYIFVKEYHLKKAMDILSAEGYQFV